MRGGEMLTASHGNPLPSVAAVSFLLPGAGDQVPANFALVAFAAAEFLNVLSVWLKKKRWDSRRFLSSSGVISSLSAMVASLAVAVVQQEGADSSSFALALVFAAAF